jgi:hypothetical protein
MQKISTLYSRFVAALRMQRIRRPPLEDSDLKQVRLVIGFLMRILGLSPVFFSGAAGSFRRRRAVQGSAIAPAPRQGGWLNPSHPSAAFQMEPGFYIEHFEFRSVGYFGFAGLPENLKGLRRP